MAEYRKAKLVDGYMALKAAQRAAADKDHKPAEPPEKPEQKKPSEAEKKPPAAHIGRTTLPTKYEVVCYECGFAFQQTGRTQNTQCMKCRTMLSFIDFTIDTAWSGELKTAGVVTVTSDGIVESGSIVASDVIMKGKVTGAKVSALRKLELHPGAVFEEGDVVGHDLFLPAGADYTFKRKAEFRNVELHGSLKAKLVSSGCVTIREGGLFQGELHGSRLSVEDGGGLQAKVVVEPAEDEAAVADAKLKKTA